MIEANPSSFQCRGEINHKLILKWAVLALGRARCAHFPKINASFDYHNIGWNEWTSRNNCLELDLHIPTIF